MRVGAEAARLRRESEDWRKLAEAGDVTAISVARTEKGLLAKIAGPEARAAEAGIPPVLRGRIGAQAVAALAASVMLRLISAVVARSVAVAWAGGGSSGQPSTTWRAAVSGRAGTPGRRG